MQMTMNVLRAGAAIALAVYGGAPDVQASENVAATALEQVILDRQGIMEGLYNLLDEMEDAAGSGASLQKLRANAEVIAVTLPAIAYMFPTESNPDHPAFRTKFPTYATGRIWSERKNFEEMLQSTTRIASELSQAPNTTPLDVAFSAQLSAACDGCHAAFRAPINLPLGYESTRGR
jgi:cytochrome c556